MTGQYFATDGVLSPFVNGTATGAAGVQIGGAGGYNDNSLKTSQRSHQVFARFDYDLTDDINAWAGRQLQLQEELVLRRRCPALGA